MMQAFLSILWFLIIPLAILAICYIFYMKMKAQYRKHEFTGDFETVLWKVLYGISMLVGGPVDVVVNIGPMSAWFLELPKEWTVTDRCKRHKATIKDASNLTRQQRIAVSLCKAMNDIGPHC